MKLHDQAFHEQLEYLVSECKNGHISICELKKLVDMAYGDYLEFHPEELPEIKNYEQLQ